MQIFTPFVRALGSALSLHHQRHQVLTENVANAETPGYRARDLEFGHVLESAFAPGRQPRPEEWPPFVRAWKERQERAR